MLVNDLPSLGSECVITRTRRGFRFTAIIWDVFIAMRSRTFWQITKYIRGTSEACTRLARNNDKYYKFELELNFPGNFNKLLCYLIFKYFLFFVLLEAFHFILFSHRISNRKEYGLYYQSTDVPLEINCESVKAEHNNRQLRTVSSETSGSFFFLDVQRLARILSYRFIQQRKLCHVTRCIS